MNLIYLLLGSKSLIAQHKRSMAFIVSLLGRKLMFFYIRVDHAVLHLFLNEGYILFYTKHLLCHLLIIRLGLLRTCILISFGRYLFHYQCLKIILISFFFIILNFNLLIIQDYYYYQNFQNASIHSQVSSYLLEEGFQLL